MGQSYEQMIKFVKLYQECKPTTLMIETMKKHNPGMKVLNIMLIYSVVRKLKVKGTINDTRLNSGIGRSTSAHTRNKH
jgi:hypothetical protein